MTGKGRATDPNGITFEATADGRVVHRADGEDVWLVNIDTAEAVAERLDAAITEAYRVESRTRPAEPSPYRSVDELDHPPPDGPAAA